MAPSCKRQIVGRNQRRQLVFPVQARDQLKNYFSRAPVEIARRLVGQQDLRLCNQRPCQCQPLLLASGKFSRTMMPARFESDFAQPPRSFFFGGSQRLPAGQQGHGDILQCGEFRQQVVKLPDVADLAIAKLSGFILRKRIHLGVGAVYGTSRRTIKSGEDVQQGTLSRARLPDDSQHRSFSNLKRQILKEHELRFA